MSESPTPEPRGAARSGGLANWMRKLAQGSVRADPTRLNTPAGLRIVDIYRRAYANGGLSTADARAVHLIWFRACLASAPSILLSVMPILVLLALTQSGAVPLAGKVWGGTLFSTVADLALLVVWHLTAAPALHARGVSLLHRTLLGFVVLTVLVGIGHEVLHRIAPQYFGTFRVYLMVLLPIQVVVFSVAYAAFEVHIDYAVVTRRWTDTPLQRLLPFDKRGKLIFLRAADHYVIVRTTRGEHELRMRFADALDRLGDARGMKVHRSFWVAEEFLSSPRKEGRRLVMRVDGMAIPISTTYRDAVARHLDLETQA